jgi:hypothetical protein
VSIEQEMAARYGRSIGAVSHAEPHQPRGRGEGKQRPVFLSPSWPVRQVH